MNNRIGEGTLIGSGIRDWLLQQFAEIDSRFASGLAHPEQSESSESKTHVEFQTG